MGKHAIYQRRGRGRPGGGLAGGELVAENSAAQSAGTAVGSTRYGLAIQFTPSAPHVAAFVLVPLQRVLVGPAQVRAEIYTDAGDLPAARIATSDWRPGAGIPAAYGTLRFDFTGGTLNESEVYWIALRTDALDAANYFLWGRGGALVAGAEMLDGSSWVALGATTSPLFKLYGVPA